MEKKIKDLHSLLFGGVTRAMAAPFCRFDINTSNFTSTSHFQPRAPSSSTPRNLDLNKLPIPEEDQPLPIQIDDPMALEDNCGFSACSFEEVKTFNDFHIVFKDECVDGELPDDIRSGYYRLCFHQKEFLHTGIPKQYGSKLVVGIIGETVNISVLIKNCSLTKTTKEELNRWDNTLEALELLGMNVKFLRGKIHTLRTLYSEAAVDIKNYREAANKLKRNEDEILRVESKIRELRQTATQCEANLCSSKQKAEEFKDKLQELVDAPW